MLLPSDVARLVLGYLQEEGLTATSQAFIHESSNLKEYAEHTTGDGTIPGCVFSIFGKGLTTILNEYVAAKTKESSHEVPAMMTSLWKKLDFTLNQIKSLQNSPAISAFQRTRSRVGVANMARQRVLAVASAGGVICSSVSETSPIISPAHTSHSMLGHSTPVCYSGLNTRLSPGSGTHQHIQDSSRLLNMARDSPVQIIVSEHRLNPGPMSPGRRKWDTPRKRSGAVSGSSGPGRSAMTASSISAEPQPEEVVDENFPQLVIQNARDKILGDRSLQEKLAENINKILANEPIPQTSKASSSTVETDQSIDEILGLQGEIHMSDDAIHDILEQTESDPAFQALFDLFDYNKTRFTDGEAGDGDTSCSPEETDSAGSSSTVRPHQNVDTGASHSDSSASDITPTTVKLKTAQDRKTRKSTAPALLKKTVLGPSGRPSRIENSSARLIVSQGDSQGVLSAPVDSSRKEKGSLFTTSANETPMDIDEPLNTPPPPLESLATQEPPTKDSTSITPVFGESSTDPSSSDSGAFAAPEETSASTVDNKKKHQQSPESKEQPATATSSSLSLVQIQLNNTPTPNLDLPHTLASSSGGDTLPVSTFSVTSESVSKTFSSAGATVPAASPSSASVATPFTGRPATPTPASTSAAPTAVSASATPVSPASSSSSCTPVAPLPVASVAATADPVTTSNPSQAAADSSNVMSLKIIISENQDEGSSSDTALNQAISNISGDKMPTIYLSSPTKSDVCPGTPKVNLDEAAQAVTGLQRSEVYASPLSSKAGGVNASPLTRTSQAQQSYIILDTTNPSLQGAPASYFIVTEPPTSNTEGRQVLLPAGVSKGPPLPTNQYAVTTPTRSPGYSTGSALILPSPVKSVVLPVSVVGPNTLGKVQMVSNQFVALPTPVPVEQTENVKPKTLTATASHSASAGTEKNLGSKVVQPVSAENTGQQDASKGPNHRRILCFDSSAEVQPQPAKTNKTSIPVIPDTSTSQSVQQIEKTEMASVVRTRPAILGGNKPKRRVQTVRCLGDPQAGVSFSLQQHQKDPVKKNSRKQDHKIHNQESQSASTSSVAASTIEAGKTSESEKRSKSVERKYNLDVHKDETKAQDSDQSRSLSSDPAPKSGSKKDKEESTRKESAEKAPLKPREGRAEKRAPSQEIPNVTANKENEIKGAMQEQQQSAPSSSVSRDLSPSAVSQTSSQSQSRSTKTPSKTSSLAKQAAEMLNDIQGIHSPSTPIKGSGAGSADLNLSGTSSKHTAPADGSRTPVRQKGKCKDGEGTPKHLMPSNTPDLPSCSPASEAGSENSINMAAHTLMILSRAAIARTGSPLKDSLRQEGVGEKSTTSSKNSKKRKQTFSASTPPAKKDSKRSPSKKKDQERKKFIDCFPHDLDVDKFLSSLHYDE